MLCNVQSAYLRSIHLTILSRVELFHLLDKCQPAASGWCPAKGCNKRKALGKTYDSNRKCRDEAPASVYLPSSRRFPPLFVPHSSTRALTLYYRPVKEWKKKLPRFFCPTTLDSVFLQKLCISTLVPRQVDLSFTQCLAPRWTPQAPVHKTAAGHMTAQEAKQSCWKEVYGKTY